MIIGSDDCLPFGDTPQGHAIQFFCEDHQPVTVSIPLFAAATLFISDSVSPCGWTSVPLFTFPT
jgi:hypothetical protein